MNADLLNFLINVLPWGAVKIATLILLVMYIIFAAVIVRQEQLMSRVVEISFSPVLRILGLLHFFASLIVFFLALILL